MAAIGKLLNPLPEVPSSDSEYDPRSKSRVGDRRSSKDSQSRKKQKLVKDAAIFTRGPVRGECRYPPQEYQDDLLLAQHQHFEVYPMGEIAEYPRHIPYNSEKKSFMDKTGRESFEVFQYRFRVPGDEAVYSMLWDYNIGLVRTTPLFKCTGYSKTTPSKMLSRNPGLREICHSITGGALVAQGYWMPYEAAKAVAATFCWKIRYALTPVFGVDFPGLCVPPDSENFGEMIIDPQITEKCIEEARKYRDLQDYIVPRASTATPATRTSEGIGPKRGRPTELKPIKLDRSATPSEVDSEESCGAVMSPASAYGNLWGTAINTPRSTPRLPFYQDLFPRQRHLAEAIPRSTYSSPNVSPKSCRRRRHRRPDDDYDGDGSSNESSLMECAGGSVRAPAQLQAAATLLDLYHLSESGSGRKRRASALF